MMTRCKEHKIINGVELKNCSRCDVWKELSNYSNCKSKWDGLSIRCRKCDREVKRAKCKYNFPYTHKVCKVCDKDKPIIDFNINRFAEDFLQFMCVDCQDLQDDNHKFCSICTKLKEISEFTTKGKGRGCGFASACKKCNYQSVKGKYTEYNREYQKKYRKMQTEKNAPIVAENKRKRRLKHYNIFCQLAEQKGGKCVSDPSEYITAQSNLSVICKIGHQFTITKNNLRNGKWCPYCSKGISEYIAISAIEHLMGYPFPKIRPDWLRGDSSKLELDGYNSELEIAIEYNGKQHYEYCDHFHRNPAKFQRRLRYDKIKRNVCKKRGIYLIVVPYTVEHNDICSFIANECDKIGYNVDGYIESFDLAKVYSNYNILDKIKPILKDKSYMLIDSFIDAGELMLRIGCERGHIWTTKPQYIHSGRSCNKCFQSKIDHEKILTKHLVDLQKARRKYGKYQPIIKKRHLFINASKEQYRTKIQRTGLKPCTGPLCKNKEQPLTLFNKKSDTKSGYQPYCRNCMNHKKREWRTKKLTQ